MPWLRRGGVSINLTSANPNGGAPPRRGLMLVLVLVVMLFAIWTASVLISTAQVQAGSASVAEQQARTQALLRSGIDVISHALTRQRDGIIAGQEVTLEDQYVIYRDGARQGVVRLLPVTPNGDIVRNEAACLDINHVTAEQLLRTGLLKPELIQAIVNRRELIGSFGSITELLAVDGMTPSQLYGDIAEINYTSQVSGEAPGLGARVLDRLGFSSPRGLADVITVYACEPVSLSQEKPIITISDGWSKQIEAQLSLLFDAETVAIIKGISKRGPLDHDGQLAQRLATQLSPDTLIEVMGALTCSAEPTRMGRVDINHASPLVLNALGGLDSDQIQQIVDRRDDIDVSSRQSPLWPHTQGLIRQDQVADLYEMATTCGLAYRFILAAGEVEIDDEEERLIEPQIFEIVIDLVDPSPRVAYLRDISLLETAARLTLKASSEAPEGLFQEPNGRDEIFLSTDQEDPALESEASLNNGLTAFSQRPAVNSIASSADDQLEKNTADELSEPAFPAKSDQRIGRWRVVK